MMVAGFDQSQLDAVEMVDLASSTTSCRDVANFPIAVTDPVAAAVDGDTWACGGSTSSGFVGSCYKYDVLQNQWSTAPGK